MTTWEYRSEHVAVRKRDAYLADAGREGWELVHVGPTSGPSMFEPYPGLPDPGPTCELILKRPVGMMTSQGSD